MKPSKAICNEINILCADFVYFEQLFTGVIQVRFNIDNTHALVMARRIPLAVRSWLQPAARSTG
jgi:hypothetical protein